MIHQLRVHLSTLLLAILSSVLAFGFGQIERSQLLSLSCLLFLFGELTLAANHYLALLGGARHIEK